MGNLGDLYVDGTYIQYVLDIKRVGRQIQCARYKVTVL